MSAQGCSRKERSAANYLGFGKKRLLNLNEVVQNRACRNHYLPFPLAEGAITGAARV